jgi:Group II intron, maturase-specific domain
MDLREVIAEVNPVLRGWAQYFRTGNAANHFTYIDQYVERRLRRLVGRVREIRTHGLNGGLTLQSQTEQARPIRKRMISSSGQASGFFGVNYVIRLSPKSWLNTTSHLRCSIECESASDDTRSGHRNSTALEIRSTDLTTGYPHPLT